MISAKIVADSVCVETGARITSFLLTYPRFIHSEFMTHRMFSRNAASSRAIPLKKMIAAVMENPAMPVHWGAEQKGMQSGEELSTAQKENCKSNWLSARNEAVKHAEFLAASGLHKSICNRVIEPWAHMTTLCTATEYINFFNLRAHKDAQPEFQELAYQMLDLWLENVPKQKRPGEWHLPFSDQFIPEGLTEEQLLKIATARAARLSYLTMEGKIEHEKDYELHDKLLVSCHLSPFDHPAIACHADDDRDCGNYKGWRPYRKQFPNENMTVLTARRRA